MGVKSSGGKPLNLGDELHLVHVSHRTHNVERSRAQQRPCGGLAEARGAACETTSFFWPNFGWLATPLSRQAAGANRCR